MRFTQIPTGVAIALVLAACTPAKQEAAQPEQVEVGQAQVGRATEATPIAPVTAQTATPIAPVTAQTGSAIEASPIAPVRAQEAAPIPRIWAQVGRATEAAPIEPVRAQVADAIKTLEAEESDREVRIILPADVLFDFDKADIRPDAAAGLQQILTVVRFYEDAPLRIEGHTDSMGDDAYNRALSDRRAASVQQWLIAQGQVASDRMTTAGLGESQPRAENTKPDGSDDPAGRQLNRRVEIVIEKQ